MPRTLWILIRVGLDADFSVFFRIPAAGSRVLENEQQLLVQQWVGDYVDYHNAGNRRISGIVDALERGIITPTTKQRLEVLEAEKANLEHTPVEAPLPAIHPNLAQLYRTKVARLEQELADPEIAAEAKSVLRSMIKTIKIAPGANRGEVLLELHGELATVLAAGQAKSNKDGAPVAQIQVSVVAGARNRHYLLFEALDLPVGGSG